MQILETLKIFYLSKHILSPAETTLLSRGLNFAPTYKPDPYVLFKDLNKYIRHLTLKRFYEIQKPKHTETVSYPLFGALSMSQAEPIEFSFETDIMDQLGEHNLDSTLSNLDLYTQHLSTSPPVQHSSPRPKSVFYPHQSKGPHITTFYNMVYADIK